MKIHPFAQLFPEMEPAQLQELADDIKKNGQQEKVMLFAGGILDGRNRFKACGIAKVKAKVETFRGTEAEALDYVISHNMRRRHLSVAQRAEIAAKIANLTHGGDRTSKRPNGRLKPVTQAEAAGKTGVSERSVRRAKSKLEPAKKKEKKVGWTPEDLGKDQDLLDAFTGIAAVYGNEDTKAIRIGTIGLNRKDVLILGRMPKPAMLAIQDLVMANHWKPEKAVRFVNDKPDGGSSVQDLQNWCLATNGKFFTAEVGGFTVTCKLNGAPRRSTS